MQIIGQLMTTHTGYLPQLLAHCRIIQYAEQMLQHSLPTGVSAHCHVANLRDRILVIHTDSPAWANRLRYLAPNLLQHWQQHTQMNLPIIDTIEVRTIPPMKAPSSTSHQSSVKLSAQTVEVLHKNADSLSYLPLKRALLRLADNTDVS